MSERPLISIAVPTYNHERFLGECLESLVNQTYNNLEIIVIDDASTDTTYKVALAYAEKYPHLIKLFKNKENQGVAKTWLRCYEKITGDFFCTFAGDDIMMLDKIELQLKALQENPDAVLCVTNGYSFDSDTGKIMSTPTRSVPRYEDMMYKQAVFAPATMAKSSALPELNVFANTISTEWIFFTEILSKGKSVYIDKPLIKYRKHLNSLSATSLSSETLLNIDSNFLNLTYIQKNHPFHKNINKGLARCHKRYARYFFKKEKNFSKSFHHYKLFLRYLMLYLLGKKQ